MTTWFTADTHFNHANICRYSNRPFQSVEEMDETLIANFNRVVKPEDVLYHLGDFVFWRDKTRDVRFYRYRLNCRHIHLVLGNHDKELRKKRQTLLDQGVFDGVTELLDTKVDDQSITLCHYAMRVWNKAHYGSWHLYGHSHGSLPNDPNSLSCDVGVDCWGYRPVSMAEIRVVMAAKTFRPVDHHGQRGFDDRFAKVGEVAQAVPGDHLPTRP